MNVNKRLENAQAQTHIYMFIQKMYIYIYIYLLTYNMQEAQVGGGSKEVNE